MTLATEVSGQSSPSSHLREDGRTWDERLRLAGGHLLQSWRWGEFKRLYGWRVERIGVYGESAGAQAQVLYKHRGPLSIGYVPRGPAIMGDKPLLWPKLVGAVDASAARHRALTTIIEPNDDIRRIVENQTLRLAGGPSHIQPARTVKIPLLDDQALLDQMHQKTRYSVRLAQRRGVDVREGTVSEDSVAAFFSLLEDTAQRNDFAIHSKSYYTDFLRVFEDQALLLLAYVGEELAAGLITARFGEEAIYMYGGSSTEHRAHGAAFLLQFEAMRWARDRGCKRYDLWGIPQDVPPRSEADGPRVAATRGDDWRGLYKFKVGFGGEIINYNPPVQRLHRPLLARLARHVTNLGG
ncbi:MAG: aminoacyltransferase [Chloroflexota bacterium]|nr:aminoacyltransferase [Chloroflexota bacterium]